MFERYKDRDLIDKLEFYHERICQKETVYLNKLTELTAFFLSSPMPSWVKDPDGRMMFCNYIYEKEFGISPELYNAQFDSKFWSEREADSFDLNDRTVVKSGAAAKFIERIYNQKQNVNQDLEVWKWPITVGGKLVGIAGQVINVRNLQIQGVE